MTIADILLERSKYEDGPLPTQCLVWQGPKLNKGYGQFYFKGKKFAHRVSWEVSNGAIPEGLLVLHKCDNPACVNAEHLFLGTHLDNVRDMIAKGRRSYTGEGYSGAVLNDEKVREIRKLYASGLTPSKIADSMGLNRRTVQNVTSGQNWVGTR